MIVKMILTNGFDPDVRVFKEAKYLVANGLDIEILCWDRKGEKSDYLDFETIEGIKIKRFKISSKAGTGMKQLPAFLRFIKCVKKYLSYSNYDFLHCHDFDGRLVGMLANKKKKPIVFDMHEFYESGCKFKRFFFRKWTLRFIKKSLAALYENDVYLRYPYSKYSKKLFSLKNYPEKTMVTAIPKTPSTEFRIGYHGAVRKQIPYFSALFIASARFQNVRVDINGTGIDYEKLKEMSLQYKNVYVNGRYNGATETNKLYANTDVLFCGYDKTVPNHQKDAEAVKFFEAIITGTPMIMQKDIGMGDKVTKEGFGISIETDSVDEIEKAIRKLMLDINFYNECRNNELKNAYKYNWENEVKILSEIYKDRE